MYNCIHCDYALIVGHVYSWDFIWHPSDLMEFSIKKFFHKPTNSKSYDNIGETYGFYELITGKRPL